MSFAKIQPITDRLTCEAGESVECAFDVFNTTSQTVKVGVEPMGDLAESGRVSVKGASEIELQPNGQEKVIVTIAPADGGAAVSGSFSLRAYNVRDVEQTVESKAVAVDVEAAEVVVEPKKEEPGGPNWGLIIGGIAAGLVLLIGGGIGIYFLVSGGGVPDVTDMTVEEARERLAEDELEAVVNTSPATDDNAVLGIVVEQSPAAGDDLPENGEVRVMVLAAAEAPSSSTACADAVQGKIAWNYNGTKSWAPQNVANLCKGAESSTGPATCFNTVMHGGVNYGGGTRWQWQNALNLCKGATNADGRVQCFKSKIAAGVNWSAAISQCTATRFFNAVAVPNLTIDLNRN